jgi:sugar lactone lactonase YvrE
MIRLRLIFAGATLLVCLVSYLAAWPVPVEPEVWTPSEDRGYTGDHARNTGLSGVERLPLDGLHGPEDAALGIDGALYVTTEEGWILRYPDPSEPDPAVERLVNTAGRPLGIEPHPEGGVVVADPMRGLLRIAEGGQLTVLTDSVDGRRILYADDVDLTPDGRIWFTDATTRFDPRVEGGTLPASLLDILEHKRTGRLLVYDPRDGSTQVAASGFSFLNGVAADPEGRFLILTETGEYRVLKHHLTGPDAGRTVPLIEGLPGFPDNVNRGRDGRFWVGLVSSRRAIVDALSGSPGLRKVVQRLPAAIRPKPKRYGHVFAMDGEGRVLIDLQDPGGRFWLTTGAVETDDWLYVTSLGMPRLGRLPRAKVLERSR